MNSKRGLSGLLITILVVLAGCSSSSPAATGTAVPQAAAATQTSEGGQVTVAVTWAGLASGAVFQVTLDTHSVDLDGLDLADAVLRNDRGERLTARPWSAPAGGHHRAGGLSFDGDVASFFASARWMELVLSGIGDLPGRTLRWELDS